MPEAAVNEHGDLCFQENEIRFAEQREVATPSTQMSRAQ
jgi:hypothetical protein